MSDANRTVICRNVSEHANEELLYELFLQVAPLERVCIPTDVHGKNLTYGFITFKHEVSVDYAVKLLDGTKLFDKRLHVKPKNDNNFGNRPSFPQQQNSPHFFNNTQRNVMMSNVQDLMQIRTMFDMNYNQNNYNNRGGRNDYQRGRDRNGPYQRQDNNYRHDHNDHKRHRSQSYSDRNNRKRYY